MYTTYVYHIAKHFPFPGNENSRAQKTENFQKKMVDGKVFNFQYSFKYTFIMKRNV